MKVCNYLTKLPQETSIVINLVQSDFDTIHGSKSFTGDSSYLEYSGRFYTQIPVTQYRNSGFADTAVPVDRYRDSG